MDAPNGQQDPQRNDDNNPGVPFQMLPLEDEEAWLLRNGLRAGEADNVQYHAGQLSSANNLEESHSKVQKEQHYERERWNAYFADQDMEQQEKNEMKLKLLKSWNKEQIRIGLLEEVDADGHGDVGISSNSNNNNNNAVDENKAEMMDEADDANMPGKMVEECYPLSKLAVHSDTIFAIARSVHLFRSSSSLGGNDDDTDENSHNIQIRRSPAGNDNNNNKDLTLSLVDYDPTVTRAFLKLLVETSMGDFEADSANDVKKMKTADVISKSLPTEYWIEACRLAHYLQCQTQLDELTWLLQTSINKSNCMILVQLADQLSLHTLFEASMQFMLTQVGNLEDSSWWKDVTSQELQESLQTMQSLLQTSVLHQGGSDGKGKSMRTHLFFSTLSEYLAIFAEQVEYYQERLEEARRSQDMLRHQMDNRGRHGDYTRTQSWDYAQSKIVKQETRVKTLKIALREQKQLFGRTSFEAYAGGTNMKK